MVSDEAGTRTYAEVRARSCRIANALIADGFPAGAHGAVLSGNAPVAFEAILGLLRADGVWVMANHRAGVDETVDLLDRLDVDILFVHSEVADRVARLRADCPRIRRYVALDRPFPEADVFIEDWLSDESEPPQRREGRPEELAFLGATGGTTGRSKGVMLTNLVWQTLLASLNRLHAHEDGPGEPGGRAHDPRRRPVGAGQHGAGRHGGRAAEVRANRGAGGDPAPPRHVHVPAADGGLHAARGARRA